MFNFLLLVTVIFSLVNFISMIIDNNDETKDY